MIIDLAPAVVQPADLTTIPAPIRQADPIRDLFADLDAIDNARTARIMTAALADYFVSDAYEDMPEASYAWFAD